MACALAGTLALLNVGLCPDLPHNDRAWGLQERDAEFAMERQTNKEPYMHCRSQKSLPRHMCEGPFGIHLTPPTSPPLSCTLTPFVRSKRTRTQPRRPRLTPRLQTRQQPRSRRTQRRRPQSSRRRLTRRQQRSPSRHQREPRVLPRARRWGVGSQLGQSCDAAALDLSQGVLEWSLVAACICNWTALSYFTLNHHCEVWQCCSVAATSIHELTGDVVLPFVSRS